MQTRSINRTAEAPKRRYRMTARAELAEATRRRILDAAVALFYESSYDDVTLEKVADRAGVALKTVLRRFDSKDGLLLACAESAGNENLHRSVRPGDVDGAIVVLAKRYEETMDAMLRYVAVQDRVPAVGHVLNLARRHHLDWLAATFAPLLPEPRTPLHRRRVAQLFAATEIYVWHAFRRRLGFSRIAAQETLSATVHELINQWRQSHV